MIIRNNKRKLFSSALSFEEITSLSHEIAKKVISGKLTKEEAIVEVMDKANWSYDYADAAVSSWIENEPTYNGMTMNSSRKPIESSISEYRVGDKVILKAEGDSATRTVVEVIDPECQLQVGDSVNDFSNNMEYLNDVYSGGRFVIVSSKQIKSSFEDEDNETIDIEVLADELVKEGYDPDIVEEIKDVWLNERSISELTDDEDREFRRDVEKRSLNSSRKAIKSSVKNKDLSNEEKDRLYEIEKREAEERYNQMDDFDKEQLKKLYGIRNLRDYLKFFVVHPNKLGDDYECFSGDPRKKLNSSSKPIEQSAGKKTNLPKNLVRQVLSNKITEDQAINRVMISQKCNRGVARVIFNRWMDQNRDSIIKSDAAIAEIQNEFNPDGNLDSWAEIYMPGSGKANTKGGELVRAAQRILAAYYASEAMIGRGLGNELVNPAARYIVENTEFELNSDIQEMLDHDIHYDDSEYDSWLKSFETKFEDYLRNNSELFSEANDDDMDDYRKDEDSEFFLNKCYVEDDNGNEYFIESEDGEWKCTDIVASNENAYSVGDEISEGDVFFEKVNKSEEYGSFEENGTTYFYEASGNPGENGEFDTFKITEVQFTDQLFEKDSFVDYEKLEELCEDGKLFDVNGNQINIEDFQRI